MNVFFWTKNSPRITIPIALLGQAGYNPDIGLHHYFQVVWEMIDRKPDRGTINDVLPEKVVPAGGAELQTRMPGRRRTGPDHRRDLSQ